MTIDTKTLRAVAEATTWKADRIAFFDAEKSETLTHESPEEAVESLVDACWDPALSKRENIEKLCPIEVDAYARDRVEAGWHETLVEYAFDGLEERLGEEFGNFEGDHDIFDLDESNAIRGLLAVAMKKAIEVATIWRCSVVETKSFDFEHVDDMLVDQHYIEKGEL